MRKLLIVLAFAGVSVTSMAQDVPTEKYSVATNSFWSNWFIQVGANWNAWYAATGSFRLAQTGMLGMQVMVLSMVLTFRQALSRVSVLTRVQHSLLVSGLLLVWVSV